MKLNDTEMRRRFLARDASCDGRFVAAVVTTGIYCRPSCPSRRPRPENVRFFGSPDQAERAGFRPCRRCRPRDAAEAGEFDRALLAELVTRVRRDPGAFPDVSALGRAAGLGLTKLGDLFRRELATTPAAFLRRLRVEAVCAGLADPDTAALDLAFAAGFDSAAAFHDAFRRETGRSPGAFRRELLAARRDPSATTRPEDIPMSTAAETLDTPIGPLRVTFDADGALARLDLPPQRGARPSATARSRARAALSPAAGRLAAQMAEYLAGKRRDFEVPVALAGTDFQRRVWRELQRIPFGATVSYGELARRIGRPSSTRAVAQACGANPVAIVVPCHRVIGADGRLTGYGGGLPLKRRLLALEGALPESQGELALD